MYCNYYYSQLANWPLNSYTVLTSWPARDFCPDEWPLELPRAQPDVERRPSSPFLASSPFESGQMSFAIVRTYHAIGVSFPPSKRKSDLIQLVVVPVASFTLGELNFELEDPLRAVSGCLLSDLSLAGSLARLTVTASKLAFGRLAKE